MPAAADNGSGLPLAISTLTFTTNPDWRVRA